MWEKTKNICGPDSNPGLLVCDLCIRETRKPSGFSLLHTILSYHLPIYQIVIKVLWP